MKRITIMLGVVAALGVSAAHAQLSGETGAHDPSTLVVEDSTYYYFATGPGIVSRWSTDKLAWSAGPSVFGSPPAWTQQAIPSFEGVFWAPDIAYFDGQYHLYYSVSSWGTIDSAIGLATSPSLDNPSWTDQGKVVQSDAWWEAVAETDTTTFNAIDPSILVDTDGSVWMAFGSYSSGILVTQLDPTTGKRLNPSTLEATLVANNAAGGGWGSSIEGSCLMEHDGFYYLLVNYGGCCSGIDSTYEIRVGRGASPTGPFFDRDGVDMRNSGGTLFLDDNGKRIGPGHFSYHTENGQDYFSYHYYDGDVNGTPTYGLHALYWTVDDWPSYAAVNPSWSGANNSEWTSGANWSDGAVPDGIGHVANFGVNAAGRYLVNLSGNQGVTVSTVNLSSTNSYIIDSDDPTLTLNAPTGDDATINVSAGSHEIAVPIDAIDNLGVNVTPSGSSLELSGAVVGPSLTKYGYGTLTLDGANIYDDSVFVRAGTLAVGGSVSAGQYASVGATAGENGTMIVHGTGNFTANSDLNIGDTGSRDNAAVGTLELRDNATITIFSGGGFFVGAGYFSNTRAEGTVNQTGGTLTANGNFDGAFVIGGRNSSSGVGTYNLSGGVVNANTNVQVGGYGDGTVNQTGGVFNSNGALSLGRRGNSIGRIDISGGDLNQNGSTTALIVGELGTGILNISGTGSVVAVGEVILGLSGGTGTVNLNGGALTTPGFVNGTGSAAINFNGGTISAANHTRAFLPNTITSTINAGGAVIDTNGFNITMTAPLLHDAALGSALDGGLIKFGDGILTLTATSTYTGDTSVQGGALRINGSLAGDVIVQNTGVLGGSGSVAGDLIVQADGRVAPGAGIGSLSISGDASLTGSLAVEYDFATIDRLNVAGQLDITAATVDFSGLGALNPGNTVVFATYGSLNGTSFANIENLPVTHVIVYDFNGDSLALVPHVGPDLDADGDVDEDDFALLQGCTTGPAMDNAPDELPQDCTLFPDVDGYIAADFDFDHDVDLDDFVRFQRCYRGAGGGVDPYCDN